MAKSFENSGNGNLIERSSRLLRNASILGAIAVGVPGAVLGYEAWVGTGIAFAGLALVFEATKTLATSRKKHLQPKSS